MSVILLYCITCKTEEKINILFIIYKNISNYIALCILNLKTKYYERIILRDYLVYEYYL